jgi:GAF domain-containing protein
VPSRTGSNKGRLLNLGEKKSGKFYNSEEIDLLHALANQDAVAVQNAQMVEEVVEKERMEEELSIARDLQVSMLPFLILTIAILIPKEIVKNAFLSRF